MSSSFNIRTGEPAGACNAEAAAISFAGAPDMNAVCQGAGGAADAAAVGAEAVAAVACWPASASVDGRRSDSTSTSRTRLHDFAWGSRLISRDRKARARADAKPAAA